MTCTVKSGKFVEPFLKKIYHYQDLDKCIRNLLSQVSPSLDKFLRSYEPKSKQKDNRKIDH